MRIESRIDCIQVNIWRLMLPAPVRLCCGSKADSSFGLLFVLILGLVVVLFLLGATVLMGYMKPLQLSSQSRVSGTHEALDLDQIRRYSE